MTPPKTSVKKMFIACFSIIAITIVLSFILLAAYSFHSYRRQIQSYSQAILDLYKYELESTSASLLSFNQETYTDDYNFIALSLGNYTASEKIVYEYNLRHTIRSRVAPPTAILIFNEAGSISMYKYGRNFSQYLTSEMIELKQKLMDHCRQTDESLLNQWTVFRDTQYSLLMNTYKLRDMYVCSVIDLEKIIIRDYQPDEQLLQFAFYNDTDILTNAGYAAQADITIADIQDSGDSSTYPVDGHLIQAAPLAGLPLSICCIIPMGHFWVYSRVSVILMIAVFLILGILVSVVFTLIRRFLIFPLNQIALAAEYLESGHSPVFPVRKNRVRELQQINDALSGLIRQKITLEQDNRSIEQEKEHAELQYLQLQTRSHFFINCLKSLYHMAENKEYEKMRRMILAFSDHLRYIFHDTLKLVPLRAELKEVNDYYNILLLDMDKPLILHQQVDRQLLDYPVPPLLIQTFLENSFKYCGRTSGPLCFTIRIDRSDMEGQAYLRLRLSDNGVGYSEEMLRKLNQEQVEMYGNDHVGISNLMKRIQLIYQDYHAVFLNEPVGGAVALICLPINGADQSDQSTQADAEAI